MHPMGFAYYADGAHDDVDELEEEQEEQEDLSAIKIKIGKDDDDLGNVSSSLLSADKCDSRK